MLPEAIDRYEIKSVLGTGAMGSVYLAWDPKLHREVALKVVRTEVSSDPKWRERFQREARAVAALRHPNVVEIYDYSGTDSEQLYIVMEKLDGDDLFNIVEERGPMPESAAAAVGHELCLALEVAHEAGIIHRDLKPENIFVNPAGRVVLTDFGIVKAVAEGSPVSGFDSKTEVIGTPGFMPPEMMLNKDLGPYSDVFGLGALLYNIATGKLPYEGNGPVHIYRAMQAGKYEDPRQYNPLLSEELCAVLAAAVEPKVRRRTATMAELREGLKAVLAENGVSDLRDDLREYMQDSRRYTRRARARTVDYLVQRIKIATKDRDLDEIDRLRDRIFSLDPENSQVRVISGLHDVDGSGVHEAAFAANGDPSYASPLPAGRGTAGGAFKFYGSMIIVLALAVAGFLLMNPAEIPPWVRQYDVDGLLPPAPSDSDEVMRRARDPIRDPIGDVIVEERRDVNTADSDAPDKEITPPPVEGGGQLQLTVKGGPGVVFVDGEKIGKVKRQRTLSMGVGKHVIEIRGKGGSRVKRQVVVTAGGRIELKVELKPRRVRDLIDK